MAVRELVRYARTTRGQGFKVKSCWPSPTGGAVRYDRRPAGKVAAEDLEPRAVSCFHCGYPIDDYAAIDACPLCGSTNVLNRP